MTQIVSQIRWRFSVTGRLYSSRKWYARLSNASWLIMSWTKLTLWFGV